MNSKFLEIRDAGILIPVIVIKTTPSNKNEKLFLLRGGWDTNSVILININGGADASRSPSYWQNKGDYTLFCAHKYIIDNYDSIENYAVIDVEYILGTTNTKKISQILPMSRETETYDSDDSEREIKKTLALVNEAAFAGLLFANVNKKEGL